MEDKPPIFFAVTRSFWACMATIALILGQGEPMIRSIATLVAMITNGDADVYTQWGVDIAPLFTLGIVLQQRAGASRPYTTDPRAIK